MGRRITYRGIAQFRHRRRRSRARLCSLDCTRVCGDIVLAARKGATSAPGPNSRRDGGGHAKKFAPVLLPRADPRSYPVRSGG